MAGVYNLTFGYEDIIFDNFTFEFPENGVVCITGSSGCGKTTLLNILSGIIYVNDYSIKGFDKKISYVFQEYRLLTRYSVYDNILAVCDDREKVRECLESVFMWESRNKKPRALSGGMSQRVSIARAMAYNGEIFILDEPFKGIDEIMKKSIMTALKEYIKHKLCILVTHNIDEAKFFSKNIYELYGKPVKIEKRL